MQKDENRENKFQPKIFKTSDLPQIRHYPKYWAEKPPPIKGELLSSWMIRTILANMTDFNTILENNQIQFKKLEYYLFEKKKIKNMDINNNIEKNDRILKNLDYVWIPELMELFIEHTGIKESKLRELSLFDFWEKLDESIIRQYSDQKFFDDFWKTRKTHFLISNLRICPICLKEGETPFIRKTWQIILIPLCLKHKCFFEIRCPRCRRKLTPYKLKGDINLRYCFNCKLDLSSQKPRYIIFDRNNYLSSIIGFFQNNRNNLYEKIAPLFVEIYRDDLNGGKLFYLPFYDENYLISRDKIIFDIVGKAIQRIT